MSWSVRRIIAVVGAAVAAVTLAVVLTDSEEGSPPRPDAGAVTSTPTVDPGAEAGAANLWVDTDGGTCERRETVGPYSTAAACGSFGAAYRAALGGDTILVKAGAYGTQRIRHDADVTSRVLLGAAPQEKVTAKGLVTFASSVHYRDIDLVGGAGLDIRRGKDVIAERITAGLVGIASCERTYSGYKRLGSTGCGHIDGVLVKNSEFGPLTDVGGSYVKTMSSGGDGSAPDGWATDVVFDGVHWHDHRIPASQPDAHLDCLHIFHHGDGLVVRNSRFENCGAETDEGMPVAAGYGILWGSNKTGDPTPGELVENNVFGRSGINGFALRGGEGESFNQGPTVRFNSGTSISPQTANTLSGLRWYGNAVEDMGPECRPGITYRFNVTGSLDCGGTNVQADPGFVSSSDIHGAPGSNLIDAGGRTCPPKDIDGDPRPQGAACDAGADEAG